MVRETDALCRAAGSGKAQVVRLSSSALSGFLLHDHGRPNVHNSPNDRRGTRSLENHDRLR
jgi:hypothetical protein